MKKLYLICVVLTIVVTVTAKLLLSDNASHPVFKAVTYDEFVKASRDIPTYSLGMDGGNDVTYLLEDKDHIFQVLEGNTSLYDCEGIILVVEAENGFKQYIQSHTQNVTVKEVVKGDAGLNGKRIRMADSFGAFPDDNGLLVFSGINGRNIMIPGHRYLVFCEKTEISDYEDIPSYRLRPNLFASLDLSSDYSKIVDVNDYTYENYVGSEFCVNNQEILDVLLTIKHDILERYYHN